MKKTIYLLLIFLCPLFALSKGFILKGNIEGLQAGAASLAYVNERGEDTTLTALIANGAFTFSGAVLEPELARLTITEGWPYNVDFFLENAALTVHLVEGVEEKTTITGSASQIAYQKLEPGLGVFFEYARQSKSAHQQAAANHDIHAIQMADSIWFAQQKQWIQSIRATITSKTEDYAALHFIQWLLFKPDNYTAILSVFNQLSPAVRQSLAGKKFRADFDHLFKTATGQPAPEIGGKDTSGYAVTLASLKGKVVLLDFWASYCGPCRQENRNMLSVYQKYHGQGFEIVSCSLDDQRRQWVQAILADGMVWPQVAELRGGAGATAGIYEITDLPRNVLIDKAGKIYAKDLHGDDLVKALESLLQKVK